MELEDYPEKKIQVFDTLSAGPEMELILQQILREIQAGGSFEEICARITDYRKPGRESSRWRRCCRP